MAENKRKKTAERFFPLCGITLGIAALLYWMAAGIAGGFRTSVLWVWAAAGTVLILVGLADRKTAGRRGWIRLPVLVLRYAILVCAVWFFSVQALVISAMNDRAPAGADVILVLGAQVKGEQPGIALTARLESAYEYLSDNPGTRAILCGGQGPGENVTEAECMHRFLTERGIDESRLTREDRSTSTAENVRFAREMAGEEPGTAVVLTSHFHLWRAVRLARSCGWETAVGHAAPFSPILTPHYMAREFLTITVDTLRGNLK